MSFNCTTNRFVLNNVAFVALRIVFYARASKWPTKSANVHVLRSICIDFGDALFNMMKLNGQLMNCAKSFDEEPFGRC